MKINKNKTTALAQIFILIFGIIAISCALGSGVGVVSGQDDYPCSTTFTDHTCMSGSLNTLQNNNDCKTGKVCNDQYCCGAGANLYCCKAKTPPSQDQETASSECLQGADVEYYHTPCSKIGNRICSHFPAQQDEIGGPITPPYWGISICKENANNENVWLFESACKDNEICSNCACISASEQEKEKEEYQEGGSDNPGHKKITTESNEKKEDSLTSEQEKKLNDELQNMLKQFSPKDIILGTAIAEIKGRLISKMKEITGWDDTMKSIFEKAVNNVADNAQKSTTKAMNEGIFSTLTKKFGTAQEANKQITDYLQLGENSDGAKKIEKALTQAQLDYLKEAKEQFKNGELGYDGKNFFVKGSETATSETGGALGLSATGMDAVKAEKLSFGKSLKVSFAKGEVMGVKFGAYIFETIAVAAAAKVLYMQIYKLMGAGARNAKDVSDAGWIIAGSAAGGAILIGIIGTGPPGWVVGAVVLTAMALYTGLSHQDYSRETYTFQALVWQPKDGGEDCTKCNDLRYGCGEYQCRAFGKACEVVNAGTDKEACTWKNKDDITPPLIEPLDDILKDDYKYEPLKTLSPPDKGVQIYYKPDSKGCIPVFSGLEIGIRTYEEKAGKQIPEIAECKIDIERKRTYDELISYFSEGPLLTENHTMKIPSSATPSQEAADAANWTVKNGEMNSFYIGCKDANGNPSPLSFVIEFCVQDSPDTKAPTIIGTNYIKEKTFFRYNLTSVPLEVYTDEPADCKWDYQDLDYERMQNNMTKCSQSATNYLIPSTFDYGCSGTINGLKDGQENTFYIRCQDKPWLTGKTGIQGKQYSNQQSYKLILVGTEPLLINEINVNGKGNNSILKDATDNIKVQLETITYAGADNGKARCQYNVGGLYYDFFNDGTMEYMQKNTQDLWFLEGVHEIPIRCTDEGGNVAEDTISFTVDTDRETPIVTRAYYDVNNLRIITNEEAECVYSTNSNIGCNYVFDDGTDMASLKKTSHYTAWESNKKYYIKCRDIYGNQPMPQTACSIIVRAFEDYSGV